jgi:prepilin-type N-terminal cleavage/methylation domain-containing protein
MTHDKKYTAGFTLVELAIVLVIIALIVSGVLVGQELVQQARLRKVMNQIEQFDRASNTFRLKYDYFPGDFPGAHTMFGQFSGCANTTNVGLDFLDDGCNGNGNGYVNIIGESLLFWAHISLAGMLPGTYTGFAALGASSSIISTFIGGVNAPWVGPHKGLAWAVSTNAVSVAKLGYVLGKPDPLVPGGAAYTTREALTLDTKLDDSKPLTGRVNALANDCVDTGEYDLSLTSIECTLGIDVNQTDLLAQIGAL